MVNIVIPSCGNSEFFKGSYYPKTLYEINGSPMIQQVILNYSCVKEKHFIFLFLFSNNTYISITLFVHSFFLLVIFYYTNLLTKIMCN